MLPKLWVHGTFAVRIVIALFDDIGSLGSDSGLAKLSKGSSLLHLPVDQLDLLLHFLKHLGQTALLED